MRQSAKRILAIMLSVALAFTLLSTAVHAANAWPTEDFETGRAPLWLPTRLIKWVHDLRNTFLNGTKLDSLLIMHNGKLVFEEYYNGYDAETPHYMASVTKSVVSALTGIAIGDGLIGGVDDKVVKYFPEARDMPGWEESKAGMTVEHLLMMTSGIRSETDEIWDGYFAEDQKDAALYAFLIPQETAPGEAFYYDNIAPTILLGIIERASGRKLLDYAQEKLFGPIGMTSVKWETTADGLPAGGFGIDMTPRDMMRFGCLYLNNGEWDGRQVIPANYVADTQPSGKDDYGYMFWRRYKSVYAYEAAGSNGQNIIIIPKLNVIIVRTTDVWDFIRDVGKFFWPFGRG